jgi:hypothetical protein
VVGEETGFFPFLESVEFGAVDDGHFLKAPGIMRWERGRFRRRTLQILDGNDPHVCGDIHV